MPAKISLWKTKRKRRNWRKNRMSPERAEYLMLQIARYHMDPKMYSGAVIRNKLGISGEVYNKLRNSDHYISICQALLKPMRDKYEAQIQAVLLNRALKGSKWHMDTYYQLQGSFAPKKIEVTHKDVPSDPKEIQEEIDRLTSEVEISSVSVTDNREKKSGKQ